MNFFKEKPVEESEDSIEKENHKESSISKFTGWFGDKLSGGKKDIIQKSREGAASMQNTADALAEELSFTNEMRKNGLRTPALCSMMVLGVLLAAKVGGPLAVGNMPHLTVDDLTSFTGSIDLNHLADTFTQAFNHLSGIDLTHGLHGLDVAPVANVAPVPSAPVNIDHSVHFDHPIGSDGGDGGGGVSSNIQQPVNGGTPNYTYEGHRLGGSDNISQNPFINPDNGGSSAKYDEIMRSVKGHGTDPNFDLNHAGSGTETPVNNADRSIGTSHAPETASTGNGVEQNSGVDPVKEAPVVTEQQKTASVLESQVKSHSTGESVVKTARTVGSQVGSGIASTSGPAVTVKDGVAHIG